MREKHVAHEVAFAGGFREMIVVAIEIPEEKKVLVRVDIVQKDSIFYEDSSIFFAGERVRPFDIHDHSKVMKHAKRIIRKQVRAMMRAIEQFEPIEESTPECE
jgi:seryl-tRNA synthetase